jgi:hypothetical protein
MTYHTTPWHSVNSVGRFEGALNLRAPGDTSYNLPLLLDTDIVPHPLDNRVRSVVQCDHWTINHTHRRQT